MKPLTEKQKRFVNSYDGSIKEAAKKSGLSYDYCRRMVTKSHIKKALEVRSDKTENKQIATREQRQEFWTGVMREGEQSMKDRLKASELLGRSEVDFTDKTELSGGIVVTRRKKRFDGK